MTGQKYKRFFFFLFLVLGWLNTQSQLPPDHNFDSWWSIMGKAKLNPGLSIGEEVHIRRSHFVTNWQQLVIRPYVEFGKKPKVKWGTGLSYIHNYPYGFHPNPQAGQEVNIFGQAVVRSRMDNIYMAMRLRLEERYMWPDHHNRIFSQRIRYRAQVKTPLFKFSEAGNPVWLHIQDEMFFNANFISPNFGIDQNWFQAGFIYFPTDRIGFETGFLFQMIEKSEPTPSEQNYTLTFQVLWNWEKVD